MSRRWMLREVVVSNETCNHDIPTEIVFDITKPSGQMKFLGLSERASESGNELAGLFDWTCQGCNAVNQDTVVVKPQEVFFAQWTCRSCSRVTVVRFLARAMAEWIAQHTLAVTGRTIDAPPENALAVSCRAACGKRLPPNSHMVLTWILIPVLVVVLLWMVLDMRRVSSSSAAPQTLPNPATSAKTHTSIPSMPSARIVGYWIGEHRDHVLCFGPIDRVQRTGAYSIVYRGDSQGTAVPFRILHEETEGEQIVVRKETPSGDRLVVEHQGDEITYRVQSDGSEVTFNVAKDGKSMTCLEVRDGEPVATTYYSVGDAANP